MAQASPSRESLEEAFRELSDEELLRRCASGELTELAQSIGLAEVRARGLGLPAAAKPVKEEEPPFLGDWVTVARYLSYGDARGQPASSCRLFGGSGRGHRGIPAWRFSAR